MKATVLASVGLLFAAAAAWAADDGVALEGHTAAIHRAAGRPGREPAVVLALSQDLGISAETLVAQRGRTGLGWGEILIANRIARHAGMTFDQVLEARAGKGWGELARAHGLNLGTLVAEVRGAHGTAQVSGSAAGRFQSGGRPEPSP